MFEPREGVARITLNRGAHGQLITARLSSDPNTENTGRPRALKLRLLFYGLIP